MRGDCCQPNAATGLQATATGRKIRPSSCPALSEIPVAVAEQVSEEADGASGSGAYPGHARHVALHLEIGSAWRRR